MKKEAAPAVQEPSRTVFVSPSSGRRRYRGDVWRAGDKYEEKLCAALQLAANNVDAKTTRRLEDCRAAFERGRFSLVRFAAWKFRRRVAATPRLVTRLFRGNEERRGC